MRAKLILALPSKGRLMEECAGMLAQAGLAVTKAGSARGYKGEIASLPNVEVNFISSSEIAQFLKNGSAHLGITGEDLLREAIADCDERVAFLRAVRLRPCRRGGGRARLLDRRAAHGRPGGDGGELPAHRTAAACALPPST